MSKIFISFNIVSADDCILVVRDLDNLAGEVFRQYYPAPHSQENLTVDDLEPVMHRVEIWSTPDGTTLAALKGSCDIDASMTTDTTSFDIITFIVDRGFTAPDDPEDGDSQYINEDLAGKELVPFKPGFGALVKGTHFDLLPAGGFELIDGSLFNSGEEWTVLVQNTITTVEVGSSSGYPSGIVQITADTDFVTATHKNKLLKINGSGAVITLSITDMAAIPDNTVFGICTHAGTQRYLAIDLPTAKYVEWFGAQKNTVWLGKGELVQFIKSGDALIVVHYQGDGGRVGDIVKKDGLAPLNSLQETGGWYLKSDYPRIFQEYINGLPVGDLGSGTQDVTPDDDNKTKFIIGTTKFWMPDRRDQFERNTDGIRTSGEVQEEMIGPHFHDAGTDTSDVGGSMFNRSVIDHLARSWNVGNSNLSAGQRASTDLNKTISGLSYTSENRPKNITVYSYRII